jgi:hypothetical protein
VAAGIATIKATIETMWMRRIACLMVCGRKGRTPARF